MNKENNTCVEGVFDRIYKEISPSLRNFAYFKCGDEDQSNDLVQEAFIKLWDNCKKVPPTKAKSFLYTVTNNLFLNTVAHKKVVFKYAEGVSEKINKQTPQFALEEKEFGERLEAAISNLTEVQRTAFLMSRVEGKKYREIAEILE